MVWFLLALALLVQLLVTSVSLLAILSFFILFFIDIGPH